MSRSIKDARRELLDSTKLGLDSIIDLLSRPIRTNVDHDKLKSAVTSRSQAVNSIKQTLVFVDEHGGAEEFIREKVVELIGACWDCFDSLTRTVIPLKIKENLTDDRMTNAVLAKDVARDTSKSLLEQIERLDEMLKKGDKIKLKKDDYDKKIIEKRAKRVGANFF